MSRVSTFPSHSSSRPPSEQLCDLHVYKVPLDLWRTPLNNILNQSVTDTISLGIIRVPPDLALIDIRAEIQRQLEELAPKDYVFLRSVGRSITRLKGKQEYQLKAKHFLPPVHYAPELYILEATPEIRDALALTDRSSNQSPSSLNRASPGGRSYREAYRYRDRNGYPDHGGSPRSPSPARKGAGARTYRGANGYQREAAYTNNTNEDSGVAGMSPDDQYKNRDKDAYYDGHTSKSRDYRSDRGGRYNSEDEDEEEKRRLRDIEDRRDRWAIDQDERRRRAEEDQQRREEDRQREETRRKAAEEMEEDRRREEEDRRRREEDDRRREEDQRRREEEDRRREEEDRRREEEDRRREEEERRREEEERRQEEETRLKGDEEDLNRFPSPPPLHLSPDGQRETESARQQRREEHKKLLEELEEARDRRQNTEKEREDLVKKAKTLQSKTQNRRNLARDVWKKRYFEEKKKTSPLEEQSNRLREELDALHRKLMSVLEGPKEKNVKPGDSRPSQRNNYIIQCTRLQHDIDDLKRRVENAKMKLTAEMKLRSQAEAELRAVRSEAIQKKINMRGQPFQVY